MPLRPFATATLACFALIAAGPLAAQSTCEVPQGAPLSFVNDDTQVRSLAFRSVGERGLTLDPGALELQIATTAPSLCERLPTNCLGIASDKPHPLLPIELQRDVVRLQRYYERSGFPRAYVDYGVRLDSSRNAAAVTFCVSEGPELVLERVEFGKPVPGAAPGAPSPLVQALAPELRGPWAAFREEVFRSAGERLTEPTLVQLQNRALRWLRTRGYVWANVSYETFPGSNELSAVVRLKATPGPRAIYDAVRVERVDPDGQAKISDAVILRELPFRVGDTFDARDLSDGQREIFQLGAFQLVTVDVVPEDPPYDSTVSVVVRVREAPVRAFRAFTGYFTEGGVTLRGELTHRNALGGARTATAAVEARTGIADRSGVVDGLYDYRASVSLRQPYVFNRALSFTATPAYRNRNDEIERSTALGLTGTLLYARGPLKTAGLNASVQRRRVDFQGGATSFFDLGRIAASGDTLSVRSSAVGLDATWGLVDDPLRPTSGVIVRPSIRTSTPLFSDFRYARGELAATGFYPLGERTGVTARAAVGALRPLAETSLDSLTTYVLLRDQYFYGGGAGGTRGWAVTLLGPKVINFRETEIERDGAVVRTDTTVVGYAGIGGRSRVAGSVQMNLPLPIGPQWGAIVFLDGGAVQAATDPENLGLRRIFGDSPATDEYAALLSREGGFRYAAGAGFNYITPVGQLGLAVGVKLNPSYLDLRSAEDVLCGPDEARSAIPDADGALFCDAGFFAAARRGEGFAFDEVPASFIRRLQFQLTFGQSF